MYPKLVTDIAKLRHNINEMTRLCHTHGVTAALVTKCVCADGEAVRLMDESDCDFIADSRLRNLASMKVSKPRYLLRIAQPSEAEDAVRHSEVSQQSEIETVRRLGRAAREQQKRHKVVVMIDMGDLREGVFIENTDDILALASAVCDEDFLELYGVGVNLTCFGGILPDDMNLGGLVRVSEMLREKTGEKLPFVSGGNSSSLPMLISNKLPKGITNLRIGEGYLLGRETVGGTLIDGFYDDCFTLEAELIEKKRKPSKPIGTSGMNAFGERVEFEDLGMMERGICAVGRQDTEIAGLSPRDKNITILGASSDHLLLDLSRAEGYNVGNKVAFGLDYGALLHASTSRYIEKAYIDK